MRGLRILLAYVVRLILLVLLVPVKLANRVLQLIFTLDCWSATVVREHQEPRPLDAAIASGKVIPFRRPA